MPYYNAAKYIKETVEAIIAQTYPNWELIIVDDCSPAPETSEVLQEVETMDKRIKVINATINGGAGAARNIGIKAAQGRYLAFCDSDDWWYPTKLEEQLRYMEENDYPFTCTWYEDADEDLNVYYTMKQATRHTFASLRKGCDVGTPGVIIDVEKLGKKYMPELRRAEDWGFWLSYLKEVRYLHVYPKALWKYRHISGSETSNKFKMLKAVVKMYDTVLGYSPAIAWSYALFVFLPGNIFKKLKKKF